MKISKTAVLTAGSALMIAGLGLMFVSAADKNLYADPNNAIQHFETVRIVPIESGDNSMADIVKQGNIFGIKTDYNFALSRSGTDANQISGNTMGSSILGGIVNKILGGIYNGILGGKNNEITTGNNNGILGGENNEIGGNYSVIFGGKGNEIGGSGSYSAIVGGSGNKINGSYSVVVGRNNNTAKGYNSVAMGSGSKLNATSSFLWTDGIYSGNFTTNHVFAVLGDNGMVINATGAHDLAQLTISGVLVVYDDKNAPKCTPETKGVLKVVTGDNSTTNQECFCSCDGSGRNVLHEGSNCVELCKDDDLKESPECGDVVEDCSDPYHYHYTGSSVIGACVKGQLIRGTGAFFVSSTREGTGLINYINRSCQVAGEITGCQKMLEGNSCPNLFTDYECLGKTGDHWLTNDIKPRDSATRWEYSETGYDNKPCKYICDQWSHWDSRKEECIPNACGDLSDSHAHMNNSYLPTEDGKEPEYKPGSNEACTYDCDDGYDYDYSRGLCRALQCEDFNIPNATQNFRDGYPTQFDQAYEYQAASDDNEPCTYHCADGFGYKEGECKPLACVGTLPDNTELVHPTLKPTDPDTKIFYDPDSKLACAYMCKKNYIRSGDNCVSDLKNCSVGLRESTTSTSAKTLSSSYTVSNLGSSNVWECKYTNDGTVKLFAEECDDEVQSFNTKLGSLTMNQGYKFKGWYVDGVLKSSDLNNGLNLNCGDMADLKWDCDEENDYERYNGHCMKKTGGECRGSIPDNAEPAGLGEERVPDLIDRLVYPDNASASDKYCAYVCKDSYKPVSFNGIYSCVSESGEVSCNNKKGYINGEDSAGNITCVGLSNCIQDNQILSSVPSNGKSQWEYLNYRPVGGNNDLLWKCTDGTPTQNKCEYQCKDSYGCQDGVCEPYSCPVKDIRNLYQFGWNLYFTDDVITKAVKGGGTEWIHIPEDQSIPTDTAGCYYQCKPGQYFGRNSGTTGCLIPQCTSLPEYYGNSTSIVTKKNPRWYLGFNSEGTSVNQDDWTYDENPGNKKGCFYYCSETAVPVSMTKNGVSFTGCIENECLPVTVKNLYQFGWDLYFTNDVITKAVKGGGTEWIHIPEDQSIPTDTAGCYYQCKPGQYFGRYSGGTGCLIPQCEDMPNYLYDMYTNGLIEIKSNPRWYKGFMPGGIYVNEDEWTFDKDRGDKKGCFYKCAPDTQEVLMRTPSGVYYTGCTQERCPLINRMNLYGSNDSSFTTDVNTGGVGTGDSWVHIPENQSIGDRVGCYFQCKPGQYYGKPDKFASTKTGCLIPQCEDMPRYLKSVEVIIKTNPMWYKRHDSMGNEVDQDKWTYNENPGDKKGCFWECDTSKNYYHVVDSQGRDNCQYDAEGGTTTKCRCDGQGGCATGLNGYLCEKEIKQNGYICKEQQPDGTRTETPICSGEGTGGGGTTGGNLTTVCDGICETCFYNDNYGEACTPSSVPVEIESCTDSGISGYVLNGGAWDMVSLPDGSNMCIKCIGSTAWHGDPDYKCK